MAVWVGVRLWVGVLVAIGVLVIVDSIVGDEMGVRVRGEVKGALVVEVEEEIMGKPLQLFSNISNTKAKKIDSSEDGRTGLIMVVELGGQSLTYHSTR